MYPPAQLYHTAPLRRLQDAAAMYKAVHGHAIPTLAGGRKLVCAFKVRVLVQVGSSSRLGQRKPWVQRVPLAGAAAAGVHARSRVCLPAHATGRIGAAFSLTKHCQLDFPNLSMQVEPAFPASLCLFAGAAAVRRAAGGIVAGDDEMSVPSISVLLWILVAFQATNCSQRRM